MCYPKGAHSLGHRWGTRLVDYKKGYFISVKFSKKIRNIAVFKYWHLFQILCKSLLWQPYIAYCKAILRKAILNASIIRIACPNYKSLFAYPLAERGGKNHLLLSDKIFFNILEKKCWKLTSILGHRPSKINQSWAVGQANLSSELLHDNIFVQALFHGTDNNFADLRDHNAEYFMICQHFMFLMGWGRHFYTKWRHRKVQILALTTEIGLPHLARGQANLNPPLAKGQAKLYPVHARQILV